MKLQCELQTRTNSSTDVKKSARISFPIFFYKKSLLGVGLGLNIRGGQFLQNTNGQQSTEMIAQTMPK